jgi:hypothetical protein
MDFSAIIERIPRLNREMLTGLILRQDVAKPIPACYFCWESLEQLHLFKGRLLCTPCVKMETARGSSPRWMSARNIFLDEMKRRKSK